MFLSGAHCVSKDSPGQLTNFGVVGKVVGETSVTAIPTFARLAFDDVVQLSLASEAATHVCWAGWWKVDGQVGGRLTGK